MAKNLRVTRLFTYPLKGCEARATDRITFYDGNPHLDHAWMVVDEEGNFVSARNEPQLCLVRASPKVSGALKLSSLGVIPLSARRPSRDVEIAVRVHGDMFSALDMGDEAAEWISRFLGGKFRIVYYNYNKPRMRMLRTAPFEDLEKEEDVVVNFADGYPILLVSEESAGAVSKMHGHELSILRWRPTIVVAGGEPFEEDLWRDMTFHGAGPSSTTIRGLKRCPRCTVPSVNPITGEPDEPNLLKTLEKLGRILPKYVDKPESKVGAMLGNNCISASPKMHGVINVGDELTILSRWA